MFTLVLAGISIALVVATLILGNYYGGAKLSEVQAMAEALRLRTEGQQIMAAADLFNADRGHFPQALPDLVDGKYLLTSPMGGRSAGEVQEAARADRSAAPGTGWRVPVSGEPIILTERVVPQEVCRKYNLVARGDDGILKDVLSILPGQCYGTQGAYRVVVTKGILDGLAGAVAPDNVLTGALPAVNTGDMWWEVLPSAEPKVEVDPEKMLYAKLTLLPSTSENFGSLQVGQSVTSASRILTNTGNIAAEGISVSTPSAVAMAANSCRTRLAPGSSCSFGMKFTPGSAKHYSSVLRVDSANAGAVSVNVVGDGQNAMAQLQGLKFGNVAAGSAVVKDAVLENSGIGPLTLSAPVVSGPGFKLASGGTCADVLPSGYFCTIKVQLTGIAQSDHVGAISVLTMEAGELSASLSGLSQQAVIAVSPSRHEFGDVQVGQVKNSLLSTVRNTGNIAVTNFSINARGPFTRRTNTCSGSLAPGASCELAFQFAPTAALAYSEDITFSAENAVSQVVALTGQGASQAATLTGGAFGDVAAGTSADQTITLSNIGSGPLSVTVPTSSSIAGSGFSFVGTNCTTTVAAGQSCTVTLRFSADGTASATGVVSINTGAGVKSVSISGQSQQAVLSVVPAAYAFGNVQVAKSALSGTITLTNIGNLALGGLTLTAPANHAIENSTCSNGLAAGASCTFKVGFTPAVASALNTSVAISAAKVLPVALTLTGSGVAPAVTATDVDFGKRAAGVSTDLVSTLKNTGIAAVSLTPPTSASVTGRGFSFVSSTCAASLGAEQSCATTLRYSATGVEAATGQLSVATEAGTKVANLTGQSKLAILEVLPSTASFGSVQIGQTVLSGVHTLTNKGNTGLVDLALVAPANYAVSNSTCKNTLATGTSCTFQLAFTPATASVQNGSAAISATNVSGVSVSVTGAGVAQAATLSAVSFGNRASATATDLNSTLTNSGLGPLSITVPGASSVSGTGFSFLNTTCTASLAVGKSCTVALRYRASGVASTTGTLNVATGAGVMTAALSGQSQQAILAVTPTAFAFGNVQVAQSTVSGSHTLTNSGNAPLVGLQLTAPANYALNSNTCTATLGAGASCTFKVAFTPTTAATHNGTLSIAGTDAASISVSYTGTGVPQAATLAPVAFGNQAAGATASKVSTLLNTGRGPLSITVPSASSVTGKGFSFSSTTCTASLAAGQSCTVSVSYSANGITDATGALSVLTGAGTKSAVLTGQSQEAVLAVTPDRYGFGDVQIGQTASSTGHTLTNTGNISLGGLALVPSANYSVVSSTCAAALAPGASCIFEAAFSPTVAGAKIGTLAVSATNVQGISLNFTGAGIPQSGTLTPVAFGVLSAGSSVDEESTLKNTGLGPLSITVPGAASVTGSGFTFLSTTCLAVLPVGQSCSVAMRYTGNGASAGVGMLSVFTGAGLKTASLTGQSQQGILTVTPTRQAFGNVQVVQSQTSIPHTLTNTGNIALDSLSFAPPANYAVSGSTCGTKLGVGESCSFAIVFKPLAVGLRNGNLFIRATDVEAIYVTLSGTGVAQSASLSDVDFGNQAAGAAADRTSTLENTGLGPLTMTVPSAASVAGSSFTFRSTTCTATLATGQSCTVTVRYSPTGLSTSTGALTITTGAGAKSSVLSGQGQQALLAVTANTYAFGDVQVDQTAVSDVHTVVNNGNIATAELVLTAPTSYTLTGSTCKLALAAGASCTFKTTFAPKAPGPINGNVSITAANAPSMVVALTGKGVSPAATLSPVAFGSRAAGTTTDLTSILENTGVGPLSITVPGAASVTGAGFAFRSTSCPAQLAPSESCTVTIRYTAAALAAGSGTLTVATGAGAKSAGLSGQSQQGVLSVTPASHAFGNVPVAQSAVSGVHTLTNTGNIAVAGLTLTPPASYAMNSNGCTSVLAAGAQCSFKVAFTPSTATTQNGSLAIGGTNVAGVAVSLTGAGVAQSATLSGIAFGSRDAGSVTNLTSSLTNTGLASLSLTPPTSASVAGGGFTFVSTTCGATLAPSSSCTTTVRYTASGAAAAGGTLTIATGAGSKSAALTGQSLISVATVTSVSSISLSGWYAGTSTTGSFRVRNDGNTAMTLIGSGLSGRLSVSANTCSMVSPGASCVMTVALNLANVGGSGTQSMGIAGATAGTPYVSVNWTIYTVVPRWSTVSMAFGNLAVGKTSSQTIYLYNDGATAYNWASASWVANHPAGYTFNTSQCSNVAPNGGSCAVTITFTPTQAVTYEGSGIYMDGASYVANTLRVFGRGI